MEPETSPGVRYGRTAIALHWAIALLIVTNFALAWIAEDLPKPDRMALMGNHLAIGMAVLLLSVLRVVWRLMHPAPSMPETLKPWEAALAKVVHWLFYGVLIALPLAGWGLVSAGSGGKPFSFFGLFDLPGLPLAQDRDTAGMFHEMHEVLATITLVLVLVHVAGALKHIVVDRDTTMSRMLPWGRPRS